MARPIKRRRVCGVPRIAKFGPHACTDIAPEGIALTIDEYEAIRLLDLLGFTQEECAVQMKVARTTIQAIYDSARRKLADALVNGKMLEVSGGSYEICPQAQTCCGKNCGDHSCRKAHCTGQNCSHEGCGSCANHSTLPEHE